MDEWKYYHDPDKKIVYRVKWPPKEEPRYKKGKEPRELIGWRVWTTIEKTWANDALLVRECGCTNPRETIWTDCGPENKQYGADNLSHQLPRAVLVDETTYKQLRTVYEETRLRLKKRAK